MQEDAAKRVAGNNNNNNNNNNGSSSSNHATKVQEAAEVPVHVSKVQEEAEMRVLAALKAVGASSPTLQQVAGAMAVSHRV